MERSNGVHTATSAQSQEGQQQRQADVDARAFESKSGGKETERAMGRFDAEEKKTEDGRRGKRASQRARDRERDTETG